MSKLSIELPNWNDLADRSLPELITREQARRCFAHPTCSARSACCCLPECAGTTGKSGGYTSSSTRRAVCAQRIAITAPSPKSLQRKSRSTHYLHGKNPQCLEQDESGTFCMVILGALPQSQSSQGSGCCARSEGEIRFKICTCLGLLSEEHVTLGRGRSGSGKSQPQYL